MTNTTLTIADILFEAEKAGMNWLSTPANRGWYPCAITGKKFRGAEAEAMFAAQEEFVKELEAARAEEQFKAEEAEAEQKPSKRTGKVADNVKVFDHKLTAEEGADTLGVLHSNGMIERITDKLAVHLEIKMIEGKPVKMTSIKCADCGTERDIKVQDAFQVKRCPDCQKKHRNRKRAERRRQQRAEEKASKGE